MRTPRRDDKHIAFSVREQHAAQTSGSKKPRLILIVVVHPTKILDFVVFLDIFAEVNRLASTSPEYEVQVVSGHSHQYLGSRYGLTMQTEFSYRDCWEPADTLLVVGHDEQIDNTRKGEFLEWLRRQASQSRRVTAVDSGVLLLAATGLLNRKQVTTHWQYQSAISTDYPDVCLDGDVLFVRDKNLYTCAGATAGLDLALSMVEEDLGLSMAAKIAQSFLLYFRRAGESPQISAALQAQAVNEGAIAKLLTWLPNNLQADLSITKLARHSAMSARNFARTFRSQVGTTPAKYIDNLRFEAARCNLESSELTVEGVALAVGLRSETLRRLFVRRLGVTPGRYRATRICSQRDMQEAQRCIQTEQHGGERKVPATMSRSCEDQLSACVH